MPLCPALRGYPAVTVFQRHLRLKSPPSGTRHLRCREAQVLHLIRRE
jgi:hypothetical protein